MPAQFSRTTRALAGDNSRYAFLAWLLSGVLLAVWLGWFFFARVTVYEVSQKARLEVKQAPHPLAALVAGKITTTSLAIGKLVQAGDVLLELDASTELLRLKEEESRLAAFAPRILSLKREIAVLEKATLENEGSALAATEAARFRHKEASAAAAFAQENERRMREESRFGSVAKVEAMRAQTESQKLAASRDALTMETRKLELDARTREHQNRGQIENLRGSVVSLEGEASTTSATIARLKLEIEKHRFRAPVSGRIGDVVPLRVGSYVTEGQRLATVVPQGDLIIIAEFNPASVLGRIRPGQPGRLRLDGFPWAQYGVIDATVSQVASEIRDNVVRVEMVLDAQSAGRGVMQHGLPGALEIGVETTSPAVLVLRAAGQLLTANSAQAKPLDRTTP